MLLPPASIRSLAVLRDDAFEPQAACGTEEIRANRLEGSNEDTIRAPRKQPIEIGLAQVQRE
ncbi:hypothetical protein XH99_01125 [Bradyrhizobium nanningense]|uniref:Uncharacterized protein n=1 Tax=Bradyrhizobium nanningense TaxID=1325118 RepID=A0A4Q0SK26_9BRAD|nr:hypothetical protein XH84_07085 [Bradyrhizobium nanningense]RXH38391.1 hypothetical protein XH99_01125 [Bradyrhizobium nanningense]